MNEWLIAQGINNPQTAMLVGLLAGLLFAVVLAWVLSAQRKSGNRTPAA